MTTFSKRIASGDDDVDEEVVGGEVDSTGVRIELNDEIAGFHFTDVTIPQGATINQGYLQWVADRDDSSSCTITAKCEAVDDATAFGSSDYDVSGRTYTSEFSTEAVPPWTTGETYQVFDLAAAIEEVVGRAGWESGNAINVIVTPAGGSDQRVCKTYERDPDEAALLYVDYTAEDIVEVDELALTSTAESLTVDITGIVSAGEATATATAESLTVVPGEVTVALGAATLTATAESLTVEPGEVAIELGEAALTATAVTIDDVTVPSLIPTLEAAAGAAGLTDVAYQEPPAGSFGTVA